MAQYIHLFETTSEFNEAYNGSGYEEPWLSLTEDGQEVHYNKTEREKLLGTPLTFVVLSSGTINFGSQYTSSEMTLEYSKNGGEWTEIESSPMYIDQSGEVPNYTGGTEIQVNAGDEVSFRGNNQTYHSSDEEDIQFYGFSPTTCIFALKGNAMSLVWGENFKNQTTLASADTFFKMFSYCRSLVSLNDLVLPATTLSEGCYYYMFSYCTSLGSIPSDLLPSTTLSANCYRYMFNGCSGLTSIPAGLLPATALQACCYASMFAGCSSLTSIPGGLLPSTTLADACYLYMFSGCRGLTSIPENLFQSTTMAALCYESMFSYCNSLTTVPSNLLPAMTLAERCYNCMFQGCSALTAGPDLPATTLVRSCYSNMFYNCTNLSYIKCLAADNSALYSTNSWAKNVSATGTFVKKAGVTWTTGASGIPDGWTVVEI